jgi:hypothetical protein
MTNDETHEWRALTDQRIGKLEKRMDDNDDTLYGNERRKMPGIVATVDEVAQIMQQAKGVITLLKLLGVTNVVTLVGLGVAVVEWALRK